MKKLFIFAAIAAPLFFSCAKEMDPQTEEVPAAKIAFTASIEDLNAPTKADINASNQLVWAAGDKIGVFIPDWGDKNQAFQLVGAGGSTTGGFARVDGDFEATTATVAYFPWGGGNNVSNDDSHFYITLPEHNGSDADPTYTSGKMLTPLVAQVTRTGDAYDPISFKHAGAAVKVSFDSNLPAYAHSIGLTANHPIYGYFNIDPANYTDGMVENSAGVNDGKTTSFLHFAPSDAVRSFDFLFPVPPLPAASTLYFNLYDKNDVRIWGAGAKTSGDVALGRGKVLSMPSLPAFTPYSDFDQISSWGVSGTHNSWGAGTPMATEVDGNIHIANDLAFEANAEFKIRKDATWLGYDKVDVAGSVSDLLEDAGAPDHNIKVKVAGTYDIIFDSTTDKEKIRVVASDVDYPDAGTMPHHTSIKKATNLGATETANCYVIKAAGNYKIPGVKGNSATTVGTIKGVELLWETYNNGTSVTANSVIAKVDYDETDNCVYFKTPDVLKPGNALIAAKDDSDNIIWSWHIWIPSSAITDIGEYAVSSKYYMDRNLGALTVATASTTVDVEAESFGMFYQWGRKDPFIGARAKGSGSNLAKYTGTTQTGTSESVDMDYAIAHPTTMAKNDNWNDGNTDRWGQGGSKTIYDPCPAGYRIPEYNSSEVLWQDVTSQGSFVANGAHGWWKVGSSFIFPMAGDGGYDYAEHAFDRTKLWTAKQMDDSHTQHGIGQYIYYKNTDPKDTWTSDELGSWQSVPGWGVRKRYFASVRCQKIEGELLPPIPAGAKGVTLATDGTISSDWASAEAIPDTHGGIKEWKYGYDSSNLYFYFKIARSSIKSEKDRLSFRKRRYIWMGFDTDNNPANGVDPGNDLTLSGCEARALVYPFTGTATALDSTAGTLEIINGQDDRSKTEILSPSTSTTEDNIYVYGNVTGDTSSDFAYIEMSVPRAGLGISSSFTGIIKVQFSLSGDTTDAARIEIE